jgi:hypothetical protein
VEDLMEEKFYFKRSKLIPIGFFVVSLILFIIWMFIRGRDSNELIFVANLILPFLIGIGIIGALLQFFVISKLYYVKLNDKAIIITRVFPKTFEYSKIKSISFNNGWFKGLDDGSYAPWPIVMRVENSENFLRKFEQKYKAVTKKKLLIKQDFI